MRNRQFLHPFGLVRLLTSSGGVRPLGICCPHLLHLGRVRILLEIKIQNAAVENRDLENDGRKCRQLTLERRKTQTHMEEPIFVQNW